MKMQLIHLSRLLKAIWLYLAGILAVVIIYFLLTYISQGVDIVIQMGEMPGPAVGGIIGIVFWAFLVWYSCRLISYIKQDKDSQMPDNKYCIPTKYHKHIPRILAYNCLVSVQVAIFQLPTFLGSNLIIGLCFLLMHNLLYLSLSEWLKDGLRKKGARLFSILVIVVYVALIIHRYIVGWQVMQTPEGIDARLKHMLWLPVIALILFGGQLLLVYYFINRRKKVDNRLDDDKYRGEARLLGSLGVRSKFIQAEAKDFRRYNVLATVSIVLLFIVIFSIKLSALMGPLGFVLLALGVLVGIANIISVFSIRYSISVFLFLFVLAILIGKILNPYEVELVASKTPNVYDTRPAVKEFLIRWIDKRKRLIDTSAAGKKFDVYIVLSNGGATRAGNWVSSTLSSIQDSSYALDSSNTFRHHLLSVAGASGGSVGNCAFYSLLKAQYTGELKETMRSTSDKYFFTDFLTFALGRLFALDIFRHIVPIRSVDDRAAALENVLANGSDVALMNKYFNSTLDQVLDQSGNMPALFINTTRVEDGMPGVVSSVKLPRLTQRVDVLDSIDKFGEHNEEKRNICLKTAAILSSRFPYFSPGGKVGDSYFVDGGYFDNSGSGTTLEFMQEVMHLLKTEDTFRHYRNSFVFHIVHINNSTVYTKPPGDIHPLKNDLLTPLITLGGTYTAATSNVDGMFVNYLRDVQSDTTDAPIIYSLYDMEWKGEEFEQGYPMSWVASHYQLARMRKALNRENQRHYGRFRFK